MKRFLVILLLISFPLYADFYDVVEKLYIAGNVADYASTTYILQKFPDKTEEANPFMKAIVKNPYVFAVVKTGLTYVSVKALRNVKEDNKTLATILLCVLTVGINYVACRNIKIGIKLSM